MLLVYVSCGNIEIARKNHKFINRLFLIYMQIFKEVILGFILRKKLLKKKKKKFELQGGKVFGQSFLIIVNLKIVIPIVTLFFSVTIRVRKMLITTFLVDLSSFNPLPIFVYYFKITWCIYF